MYYLVLFNEAREPTDDLPDHEPFIDSLIARHAILLGGTFDEPPLPGLSAAYVLRCASDEEARAIVAADPLVAAGVAVPTVS